MKISDVDWESLVSRWPWSTGLSDAETLFVFLWTALVVLKIGLNHGDVRMFMWVEANFSLRLPCLQILNLFERTLYYEILRMQRNSNFTSFILAFLAAKSSNVSFSCVCPCSAPCKLGPFDEPWTMTKSGSVAVRRFAVMRAPSSRLGSRSRQWNPS